MNEDIDDEIIDDEIPEGEQPEGGNQEEVQSAPAGPSAEVFAAMQTQLAELAGRGSVKDELAPLIEMGKQFFSAQGRPKEDPDAGARELAKWGADIQKAALTGTPEELGGLLLRAVNEVSESKINAALQQRGAPVAAKATKFAISAFLNDMRDEVGEDKIDLHKRIAKELPAMLNDRERAWLAEAGDAQVDSFLRAKYTQSAGQILLNAKPARPSDIGDKGRSANVVGAGSTIAQLVPGIPRKEAAKFEKLAESYWPDPKVRAAKVKAWAKQMNDAMASGG
jgi:hypothetical protein